MVNSRPRLHMAFTPITDSLKIYRRFFDHIDFYGNFGNPSFSFSQFSPWANFNPSPNFVSSPSAPCSPSFFPSSFPFSPNLLKIEIEENQSALVTLVAVPTPFSPFPFAFTSLFFPLLLPFNPIQNFALVIFLVLQLSSSLTLALWLLLSSFRYNFFSSGFRTLALSNKDF